jgi:23S rRNA (cytidine1920-2'-O)/16S rRNA (cytidine1409-2'-O)-methyltransferase
MDPPDPSRPGPGEEPTFVSRAGTKLEHALREFALDVRGLVCADLGCHRGGFTECLLRRGASRVYAVDRGYGVLDWRLRNDPRVVVMERTNALHAPPPPGGVDLVTIDLGWTPQRHALPAACRWLRAGGRIITLVKPQYELDESRRHLLHDGALDPADAQRVFQAALERFGEWGVRTVAWTISPISGAKSSRRGRAGNREWLVLAVPCDGPAAARARAGRGGAT